MEITEFFSCEICFHLTFLIAFVLPIAPALLIFFRDAVNSFLPLPSFLPTMPPLFPLFLSFPAFLG